MTAPDENDLKSIGKDKDALNKYVLEYGKFARELRLVMMLRFLETPGAEALTFEAYQCKNMYIRPTAAQVAACRWPEGFLKSGPGTMKPQDYAVLLALVVEKQPQLRVEVLKKVSEKELDAARARLRVRYSSPTAGIMTDQLVFLFN